MLVFAALVTGAVIVGGSVLAWRLLGWWALVVVPVALVAAARVGGRWLLARLIKAPFRAKGAVLRGAGVTVHAVSRVEPPAASEYRDWRHYLVDVTVTPVGAGPGPFRFWEPGELRVLAPGTRSTSDAADATDIVALEVEDEGRFAADEGMKYAGPRRLRLTLAVRPGLERLTFGYYFERFGELRLPG